MIDKNESCTENEIFEETKSPIEWILEDLKWIRIAKYDSSHLPKNDQIANILREVIQVKFEDKLFEMLEIVLFP